MSVFRLIERPRVVGEPVMVTGGSKGIGRSIALELAGLGCPVFLVARGQEALEETATMVRQRHPNAQVHTHAADVSDPAAMEDAVNTMVATCGSITGLIANAGYAYLGHLEEIPTDQVRRLVEVNLLGSILAARAALPHLPRGGFISFTSSVLGYMGCYGYTIYAATKHGQVGLAASLRQEVAPRGISVSVLCPPDTDTPGYAEENKTKPKVTYELSKAAGLLHPDRVASRYVRALRRGQFLINVTRTTQMYYRLHGWAPELVRGTMDRMATRIHRKVEKGQTP